MTRLEDLQPNAAVRGILPDALVTVVTVQWFGSEAIELTYKDSAGRVNNTLLYRSDEPRLAIAEQGRPWSFDGDGALFRLVSEAHRIRLAHLFDPVLAVHTSLVEPLPHQITAVYESMLPRQPLRFLLADDPGAGKTIMAGLLMKEMIARGDLHRCLVVCPGSLAEQWQDELYRRFHEWQAIKVTGQDPLAVRASKKLRSNEQLVTRLAGTLLRLELDKIPLWRGDSVEIKQLVEDFARYNYLPRLQDREVLIEAVRDGCALITWERDSFAYADSYDEAADRYRGLRGGQQMRITGDAGLLVKPDVARKQLDAETAAHPVSPPVGPTAGGGRTGPGAGGGSTVVVVPTRYHASVALDPARTGAAASRIAEEVLAHLVGLDGANVTVTLEIQAEAPAGFPEKIVRTVTENGRTLKFTQQGFEKD